MLTLICFFASVCLRACAGRTDLAVHDDMFGVDQVVLDERLNGEKRGDGHAAWAGNQLGFSYLFTVEFRHSVNRL
jgi:hypothetical protein